VAPAGGVSADRSSAVWRLFVEARPVLPLRVAHMRVLAIEPGPAFSVADVHRGWVKAHLGCDVVNFNFEDRLDFYSKVLFKRGRKTESALTNSDAIVFASKGIEVVAFEWWPQIVLVTSCFFVPNFVLKVLRSRGMKVVLLLTESPYEDGKQLERAAYADIVLLNDPTNLEKFKAINPNTYYMPHAYDPEIHHPREVNPELASDFCFVGTGFPSRMEFFEQIDWSGIDVKLGGNWLSLPKRSMRHPLRKTSKLRKRVVHPMSYCLDNSEAVEFYTSAKASANLYRKEFEKGQSAAGWAMGPREVELSACQTFFLTEERGENREVLPMVPTFEGPKEFQAKLHYYLDHEDEREDIALKAREAIAGRTFESNAGRLLGLLERQGRSA
jgi:spore maturation protein CgeB